MEVVDAEIIADDETEAEDLAVAIGHGVAVDWPSLHKYNTWEREPIECRFIKLEHGQTDEEENA